MAKEFKVFFSWQADLPSNQTKRFIEDCIDVAKANIPKSIVLVPDEATRNRFGTPDITNSIDEKILECDLFIADVSIVGSYVVTKNSEDEEPETKSTPNANVLLELGYAAGTISWDRCICLANLKYGTPSELPFDLNHRRVTPYSFTNKKSREAEVLRIAEIIKETVLEYADHPLPKKNFSHHIVGSFNLDTGNVEQKLIPYNEMILRLYQNRTGDMVENARRLVGQIQTIRLEPVQEIKEFDFKEKTKGMSVGEIMNDAALANQLSLKLTKAHPPKIDREYIAELSKKYLGFELNEEFFCVGGLKECSSLLPLGNSSLEGTDMEKTKYNLIQTLDSKLAQIDLRQMYIQVFSNVAIIPLAVFNCSAKKDERISISLTVCNGIPIEPTAKFVSSDCEGLEGCVYDEHLAKEILKLPEDGRIKYDTSLSQESALPYIPAFHPPLIDPFGRTIIPESDAEDYAQELQEYVQGTDGGTGREYSFTIGALRPKEVLWLDRVLLIKPVEGRIIISYKIKSNNTTGDLTGELIYETEGNGCLAMV